VGLLFCTIHVGYNIIFASDGEYMKLPRDYGFEVMPIKTIDPDMSFDVREVEEPIGMITS